MLKYEVGQTIVIRGDLKIYEKYDTLMFMPCMSELKLKSAIITYVCHSSGWYDLDIDEGENGWTDKMLITLKTNERG